MKNRMNTKFLVTTAVFIAIALVLRSFSILIAAGGILTMRISFSAIFYVMPGLLFGPLYGGIAGGLVDILGYMIAPMGAYIPLLTITNIIAGFLPAVLWKRIKNTDERKIANSYNVFFIILFSIGFINFAVTQFMPQSALAKSLTSLGPKSKYLSLGFMIIGAIAIMLFFVNILIKKNSGKAQDFVNSNYFKLVISLGLSGILVSTANTFILMIFTPALMYKGFVFLWAPRIAQALVMTIISSYIICILLYSYELFEGRITKKA
ncbi:folate family ECF transporter S component [uncultured Clostridium sp.]|uniref:folate family ECF transporter S component n=1 Tax=uncultured Clostridium sp. TaxID=59620 RepID=UPI0025D00075|nr:folate family ECF transporter S component [uncultured Clostridium sp.]